MNTFTVSLFGHRQISDSFAIERRLEKIIGELLIAKEHIEFLVGRDGAFDQLAASVIRRYRQTVRDDNSALVLVLPYMTTEYKNNIESFDNYYDEVEICFASSKSHFKAAHQVRNRSMVERSNLVIFYVEHSFGGAYQTMKYAADIGRKYINLSE